MRKTRKKTTFINIKAMLMMLVMLFVGFGIFGGNAFAAGMPEPTYEEIPSGEQIHTYTLTEDTEMSAPIEVESNWRYIIDLNGHNLKAPSEGCFFKTNSNISNTEITIRGQGSLVPYNYGLSILNSAENNISNSKITLDLSSWTYEDSTDIVWLGENSFTNNTVNISLKNCQLGNNFYALTFGNGITNNTFNWNLDNSDFRNGFSSMMSGQGITNNTINLNVNNCYNAWGYSAIGVCEADANNNTCNISNFSLRDNGTDPHEGLNENSIFQTTGKNTVRWSVPSPSETASTGTGTDNADGTVTVQIPITKLMHMNAADATILNDYTFTMTPADAVHTQDSYTGATSPAQTDNTVTIHKEAFNRITELNSNNNKVVISNVNNNNASGVDNDVFTLTFTNGQIGQFHYHVVETPITSGLQSGVTQDSTLYDIVVTIENKDPNNITSGEVKFAGVTMSTSTDNGDTWTKTNTGESTKSDRGGAGIDINNAKFTNTFHTADVLVDKTVRGSLGDKTKDFTFTFNVQGTNIPTTYKLYKTNAANETAEPVDVQNGSTFTLKHNESAKVMGLPEGASYRITETGTADYTTNISASVGDSEFVPYYTLVNDTAVACNSDMYSEVAGQTGGENIRISKYEDEGSDISITAASNLDEQHFTNMKGQLIPTGLIENMASFLGLALLAAFAVGYMLYKKKKDTVSEEA